MPYIDLKQNIKGLCIITTIRNNYKGYTKKEIAQANEARRAMAKIGHPTEKEFTGMIHHKTITNCPITDQDISNANAIFGPNLPGIRGKTTQTKHEAVKMDYVEIPKTLIQRNKFIYLAVDVLYVDRVPFLVTTSRNIKFITVEHTPIQTTSQLTQSLTRTIHLYTRAGFVVRTILMDGQFESLKNHLFNIVINTTSRSKHVGDVG